MRTLSKKRKKKKLTEKHDGVSTKSSEKTAARLEIACILSSFDEFCIREYLSGCVCDIFDVKHRNLGACNKTL